MFKTLAHNLIASAASFLLLAGSAQALPIKGSITFAQPDGDPGTVVTSAGVTTVTFPAPMEVTSASKDYSVPGIVGSTATFHDFSFTSTGSGFELGSTPSPIWEVGGFSFELSSLTTVAIDEFSFLIGGKGIAYGPGSLDPTWGSFTLSGTGDDGTSFTFQASETAKGVAVPDNGLTAAMLGVGLIGVGALTRRTVQRQP